MRAILLFLTLLSFWLLLSGQFESSLLVGSGIVASALTVWVCHRLQLLGSQYQPIESLPGFLLYLPWLLIQIVKSSVQVTAKSWSPRPAISPRLVEVPTRLKHPLAKTLLANSITLTPGTVTVDVQQQFLLVHALEDNSAKGVLEGSMEQRIAKMVPEDPEAIKQESSR
ncbi:MAG: Na+/H+ antiporter subunit E [Planctomycetota bacterium]